MKLQTKILLFIVPLVVVPLLVLGWVAYSRLGATARQTSLDQMGTLLGQLELYVRALTKSTEASADLFSRSEVLHRYVRTEDDLDRYTLMQPTLLRLFRSYQEAYPDYYEIRVLLPDGYEDVRSTVGKIRNVTEEEATSILFREAARSPALVHTAFRINPDTREPALFVSKRLALQDPTVDPLSAERVLRGYLAVTVDLAVLAQQIRDQRVGETGFAFIADSQGTVLFHPKAGWLGRSLPEDFFQGMLPHLPGREIVRMQLEGETAYFSGRLIHDDLIVFGMLPETELAGITRSLGGIVAGITMVAIFITSTLLIVVIHYLLLTPIRQLGAAAKAIGAGNLDVRVSAAKSDEIGLLAVEFNHMAADLQRREEQLTQLAEALQQAPDGIAVLDPDGVILHANRAFLSLTSCSPDGMQALNWADLYPDAAGTHSWSYAFEQARSGTPWHGQLKARRLDGRDYEEFCSVAPILDDNGEIVNVLVLKRDITREIQMEARVRESQKLQALGTLAGGIAHDFNNLMNPIVAYSEMLLTRAESGSKDRVRLQRISDAAVQASALVKQILAFSRPGEQAKQVMRITPLVKECVKLFEMALPPDVRVVLQLDDDLPEVMADPTQIHQILMNLLTNARHAMAEGGGTLELAVEARTPSLDDLPNAPHLVARPCVLLRVTDTGHGMSAEVRERVFEPFYSTKGLGEGTGMGLAVVQGIVSEHGGAITVASELNRGTTFRIYLPSGLTADHHGVTPETAGPVVGKERILLLEERPDIREPLCEALGFLGYRVDDAADVRQALQRLVDPQPPIDAIVLDERHVGGTGDLLNRIREAAPGIAVLACCQGAKEAENGSMPTAGISGVVQRPVSPEAIGATLQRVLKGQPE